MNYKVLYRKYRPDNFDNVIDQSSTVLMLRNAIINNKISHAYIFTGPRGTGKTSMAKIFARAINCENPINGNPCGVCKSCVESNNSSDIIEIDAASNNGVDEIRELINNVKLAPSNSKYKVYIIDEVHMMTQSAFNALLLTLEEPPSHVVFIFATTNVESVPITILSRCQRFDFHKIGIEGIVQRMSFICEKENISITDEALKEIAYLSEGGMRDALSLLDQLSSVNEKITLDYVIKRYGSVSSVIIQKLIQALDSKNMEEVRNIIDQMEQVAVDYKIFTKKIIDELTHHAISLKNGKKMGNMTYSTVKQLIFDLTDLLNKVSIHVKPYSLILLTLLEYIPDEKSTVVEKESLEIEDINEKKSIALEIPEDLKKEKKFNIDIEERKKIRINNSFCGAKKEYLLHLKPLWQEYKNSSFVDESLLSLIVDAEIVVSSKNNAIISGNLSSTIQLLNSKLDLLDKNFKEVIHEDVHFIGLSVEEWNIEKEQYMLNLKNKVVYSYMDENVALKPHDKKEKDIEFIATSVFNHDKIEIE